MAEIRTFSSIVDKVMQQAGRTATVDLSRVSDYVNQTVRELRVKQFFFRDMIELQITAQSDNYVWTRPAGFRFVRTIEYPGNCEVRFPPNIPPGKLQEGELFYWYAGVDYLVFQGIASGGLINMAYYRYPRRFVYYANGAGTVAPDRPAYFDDKLAIWYYLEGTTYFDQGSTSLDTAQQLAAQEQVTDWLLFDWDTIVPEGAAAKLFKQVDEQRARSSFALFKSFEKDLLNGESYESLDF